MQKKMRTAILAIAAIMSICAVFSGCGNIDFSPTAGNSQKEANSDADVSSDEAADKNEESQAERAADSTADEQKAESSAEDADSKPEDAPAASDNSVYTPTLNDLASQLADPMIYTASNWINELKSYSAPAVDHAGYLFRDINGDGTDELIICSADDAYPNIFAIYTQKDGKVYRILDGWSRNTYSITEDGKILNVGSSGAANSVFGVFHINESGDDIECEDLYFTDFIDESEGKIGTYHNTTGMWDVSASELVSENTDVFTEAVNKYTPVELVPTPFIDLAKEVVEKTAYLTISGSEDIGEPADYTEFNTGITENGVRIMLSADKTAEVILVSLELTESYDTFNANELFAAEITPDKPILATVEFPGSIPKYGVEVTDEAGTRFYSIDMSGYDGSIELNRIAVDNVDKARG